MQLNSIYFMISQTNQIFLTQYDELIDLVIEVLAYKSKYKNNQEFNIHLDTILSQFTPEII